MSLFDFFFPEQAQASHLRRLANQQQRPRQREIMVDQAADKSFLRIVELEERVVELERDLGFIALLLGSVLDAAENKSMISREEVHSAMEKLDMLDGFRDGKLDIATLKERSSS